MSYAFCGVFVFLILRALGELVLHRPSSGSFVSYAREFLGEKAAFVAGWMYWLNWAFTAIVDSTAIATYFHYWSSFGSVPQWLIALIALALVVGVNLISVTLFGELEFWAAADQSPCADHISGRRHHLPCRPLRNSGAANRFQRDR